jgi:hypothetical protein
MGVMSARLGVLDTDKEIHTVKEAPIVIALVQMDLRQA